jgi:hypothetical protein
MDPRVSVWIPSYGHARWLPEAIESVLAQTLPDVELVVVDDASGDGSLEIARRYERLHPQRIRVLTHPGGVNRGVEASARLGREQSRGAYLLGLASDDVLLPDALERLAAVLDADPRIGFASGYAEVIDAGGARVPGARRFGIDVSGPRFLERLVQGNTIASMTALFRREVLEQTGGHDGRVVYSDWELFVRIGAHWDAGFVPRPLALHRVHGGNASHQPPDITRERMLAVTELLVAKAPEVGGRLADPDIRATLDLQLAYLRFGSGLGASIAPGRDAAWLGDWLWSRALDGLAPGFTAWAEPRLGVRTGARHAERAVLHARAGRRGPAYRAALRAAVSDPRRAADRRLAAILLDAAPRWARRLRGR